MFSKAICMSGTFDIRRFMKSDRFTDDYWVSSPLHFVPTLKGPHLDKLRIPYRVDSWGKQTPHDWMTWRDMLPKYLGEMVG